MNRTAHGLGRTSASEAEVCRRREADAGVESEIYIDRFQVHAMCE
jgi:hypothetical protein